MELSSNILKEFAAITNDQQEASDGITAYGNVTVETDILGNKTIYVTLDGASAPTPVESLVDVQTGDRVMVNIRDHVATITGISVPAETRISELQSHGVVTVEGVRINYVWHQEFGVSSSNGTHPSSWTDSLDTAIASLTTTNKYMWAHFEYAPNREGPYVHRYFVREWDGTNEDEWPNAWDHDEPDTGYPDPSDITSDEMTVDVEVDLYTKLHDGVIEVTGEHDRPWPYPTSESGKKHSSYMKGGHVSTGFFDPYDLNWWNGMEDPYLGVEGYSPELEPFGYAAFEYRGDRSKTFGKYYDQNIVVSAEDEEYGDISQDEIPCYITPYAKISPRGLFIGGEDPSYYYDEDDRDYIYQEYGVSSSNSILPSTWLDDLYNAEELLTSTNKYMWTRIVYMLSAPDPSQSEYSYVYLTPRMWDGTNEDAWPDALNSDIDYPAYNSVEIRGGYTSPEDSIVFTEYVKQTANYTVGDEDTEYIREYHRSDGIKEPFTTGRKYRPVWPYKPGDVITVGDMNLWGRTYSSRTKINLTVPLPKPLSQYVKGATISDDCNITVRRADGSSVLAAVKLSSYFTVEMSDSNGDLALNLTLTRKGGNTVGTTNGETLFVFLSVGTTIILT